jgi:hypothetical protein
MDPELVLGTIQTIVGFLTMGIAAIQLSKQWPRHIVKVTIALTKS